MDIIENIRAIRADKGIKQSDLARRLGVDPTNYPKIEKRGNNITYDLLEKFARALDVTVVEIITYKSKESQSFNEELEALQEQVDIMTKERKKNIRKGKEYLELLKKGQSSLGSAEDNPVVNFTNNLMDLIAISLGIDITDDSSS